MKNKIIVINGPNLNLLGEREKEKYGNLSLKDIEEQCKKYAATNEIDLSFVQSNIEGEIVELIQNCRNKSSGLIINAAGYTHTSVSILDALKVLNNEKNNECSVVDDKGKKIGKVTLDAAISALFREKASRNKEKYK